MKQFYEIIITARGKLFQLNVLDRIMGIINKQIDHVESLTMTRPDEAEMFEIRIELECGEEQARYLEKRAAGMLETISVSASCMVECDVEK